MSAVPVGRISAAQHEPLAPDAAAERVPVLVPGVQPVVAAGQVAEPAADEAAAAVALVAVAGPAAKAVPDAAPGPVAAAGPVLVLAGALSGAPAGVRQAGRVAVAVQGAAPAVAMPPATDPVSAVAVAPPKPVAAAAALVVLAPSLPRPAHNRLVGENLVGARTGPAPTPAPHSDAGQPKPPVARHCRLRVHRFDAAQSAAPALHSVPAWPHPVEAPR